MKNLSKALVAALMVAGVLAVVEVIGTDGIIVRVGSIRDMDRAEVIAAECQAKFGVEVLVSF